MASSAFSVRVFIEDPAGDSFSISNSGGGIISISLKKLKTRDNLVYSSQAGFRNENGERARNSGSPNLAIASTWLRSPKHPWTPPTTNVTTTTVSKRWQTPQRNVSVSLTRLSRLCKEAYTPWNSANQNETAVKTLKLGMIVPTVISLVLRFLFRRDSLPPSKGSLAIYIVTFFPAFFLSNYLVKIGTTRRDPTTGTLISYGEDLNQTGVTEWCFDILYVTCEFM